MHVPNAPIDGTPTPGMLDAVTGGVAAANNAGKTKEQLAAEQREENQVKALWKEYETAYKFDKDARAQYALDRRYAAGTANLNWAVSANLIGSFIDILVSFLYARNPDVSVKKAPRVDTRGTQQDDDFAKTMELVISSLWKAPTARLKSQVKKAVRSALTVGVGWLKVILICNGTNIPEMRTQLNDARDNIRDLEAAKAKLEGQGPIMGAITTVVNKVKTAFGYDKPMTPEQIDAKLLEVQELEASLAQRMEVALRKALAIDYVAAEDMQVSLDVREISEYVSAGWNANRIYRPVSKLCSMFPRLSEEDVAKSKKYFQRRTRDLSPIADRVNMTGIAGFDGQFDAEAADQFVSSESSSGTPTDEQGIPFACIVELWNRETGHVHTMVEGVNKWAKEPYQPDYPSSRFYPYFQLSFYPVDGSRHPQSLSWRLMKLADEYNAQRSAARLTRERSIPGVLFNTTGVPPDEAKKIKEGKHAEFIGINPTDPAQPLRDLFAEKPIAKTDPRMYDTEPALRDMERISGVQEALQSTVATPKTATEAEIQQSGFASRTTSDRDTEEDMLTDMAHYTGELALSALTTEDAVRIAGSRAFWPQGMLIDDLLTMVEVRIEAGTTGKPKAAGDKEAWGVILPVLKEAQVQIQQAQLTGNLALADAMSELLRETMVRLGDDTDINRFIPKLPPTLPMIPGAVPPGGAPGAAPGAEPGAPPADGGPQPPLGDEVIPPGVAPSVVTPPAL